LGEGDFLRSRLNFMNHLIRRSLQRLSQVLKQMKAIDDLRRLRGAGRGAARVAVRTIPADDFDAGMRTEPVPQSLPLSVGE
jgi:hypothetical protein